MQLNYATIHRQVTLVTITGQQEFSGLEPRVNPDNQKIYTERTFVRVSGPCVFVPRRARGGCGLRDRPCVAGPGCVAGPAAGCVAGLRSAAARSVDPSALHRKDLP